MTRGLARRIVSLSVGPSGRLRIVDAPEGEDGLDGDRGARIAEAFVRGGGGAGILHLGAVEVGTELPPAFGYFRELGHDFVAAACAHPELFVLRGVDHVGLLDAKPSPPATRAQTGGAPKRIAHGQLGAVFSIEIDAAPRTRARPGGERATAQAKMAAIDFGHTPRSGGL